MSLSASLAAHVAALVADPALHDYLAILKGARNGFVYGVKIRLPHALVISILFGRGDWKARARWILHATKAHALNLASFAVLYKALLLLQRRLNGGRERRADTFLAGFVGAYVLFRERTAVNEQMVLYVAARVVAALLPRAPTPAANGNAGASPSPVKPLPPSTQVFTLFAATMWGTAMWLYKYRGETIQPGLFHSMTYIYRDSERWSGLRTLLWHNE